MATELRIVRAEIAQLKHELGIAGAWPPSPWQSRVVCGPPHGVKCSVNMEYAKVSSCLYARCPYYVLLFIQGARVVCGHRPAT